MYRPNLKSVAFPVPEIIGGYLKRIGQSLDNNNKNNNRICIAQVCRMTSEVLDGQLQSCYAARARPKCPTEEKCFKTTL